MGSMSPNPDPTDSAEQYVTELGEMVEEYSEGGILSSFNLNFPPPPPKWQNVLFIVVIVRRPPQLYKPYCLSGMHICYQPSKM